MMPVPPLGQRRAAGRRAANSLWPIATRLPRRTRRTAASTFTDELQRSDGHRWASCRSMVAAKGGVHRRGRLKLVLEHYLEWYPMRRCTSGAVRDA
jgi:hypothetical protein